VPDGDVRPPLERRSDPLRRLSLEVERDADAVPGDGTVLLELRPEALDEERARAQPPRLLDRRPVVRRIDVVVRVDDLSAADRDQVVGPRQLAEALAPPLAERLHREAAVEGDRVQMTERREGL